jgi:hypothetical protein
MAEVEVGGVKFRGGKIAIILTALSSLGGAMWGGFEFYKDYMDMREKIESYTAPDLSGFDKRLAVLTTDMSALRKEMVVFEKLEQSIQDSADAARDEARTIKRDLKGEIVRIERIAEGMDRRIKTKLNVVLSLIAPPKMVYRHQGRCRRLPLLNAGAICPSMTRHILEWRGECSDHIALP